jgi:hypothetical protein
MGYVVGDHFTHRRSGSAVAREGDAVAAGALEEQQASVGELLGGTVLGTAHKSKHSEGELVRATLLVRLERASEHLADVWPKLLVSVERGDAESGRAEGAGHHGVGIRWRPLGRLDEGVESWTECVDHVSRPGHETRVGLRRGLLPPPFFRRPLPNQKARYCLVRGHGHRNLPASLESRACEGHRSMRTTRDSAENSERGAHRDCRLGRSQVCWR